VVFLDAAAAIEDGTIARPLPKMKLPA